MSLLAGLVEEFVKQRVLVTNEGNQEYYYARVIS